MEFLEFDRAQKIRSVVSRYGEDVFHLSFSGGRDSTILSAFLDIVLPENKIPRVFLDTGLEYSLMYKFLREFQKKDDRMVWMKPRTNIKRMLDTHGYPFKSRQHSYALSLYQKRLSEGKNPLTSKTVQHYLEDVHAEKNCPKILRGQFTPDYTLKVSDYCCKALKKSRAKEYEKSSGRDFAILALLNEEGGVRAVASRVHPERAEPCVVINSTGRKFTPFRVVTNEFLDYLTEKYSIQLCPLYSPPYNMERTGCRGCPFNIKIQEDLDMLEKYFPAERKAAEGLWEPVYSEYRRLNYRLKGEKDGENVQ